MARTNSIEEQMSDMKVEDDSSSMTYELKIAMIREKGVKQEMMMSFFETTRKLAEMNYTSASTCSSENSSSEGEEEEEDGCSKKMIEENIIKHTMIKARPPTPGPGVSRAEGGEVVPEPPPQGSSDDADDEGEGDDEREEEEEPSVVPKRLNWENYELTDANKQLLEKLRENKINRMTVDLTSAQNIMKMQQCLVNMPDDAAPEMIDNMLGELFTERMKQVAELNGEVDDDAVDGIDGGRPAVISPPPGLGLLNFKCIKSGYIHQFEVWCINANAAKFIGMLILNKGRHQRIMKIHYIAHPIMNGIVIIMVETDDQFYFGSKFVEGCGQIQMLNPAEKYMEDVIGTGGSEWRTKCWNAIDCIKHTEYLNPTTDNITRRTISEVIPGLGKFGNFLTMEKEAVYGSIISGENNSQTKEQVGVFIKAMNYLVSMMADVLDGPPPLEDMPSVESDIEVALGVSGSEPTEEGKPTIADLMKNDETFFFDDQVSCDEVFLFPNPAACTPTPNKRARLDGMDEDANDEDKEIKHAPSNSTLTPCDSRLNLINEIQDHYKARTREELIADLKEIGDDLEKKCELWGFFQKTEGDLEDYLKETGELPEYLIKNQIFYVQWKAKKMIDIIFNHYDNEYPNASGKFTESFVLKQYGEYLMEKELFIAKQEFKKNI